MESFTELAEWRSIIHRLAELSQSMETLPEPIKAELLPDEMS